MGVSINGRIPIAGWFIRKNPNLKSKMDDNQVPPFQETSKCENRKAEGRVRTCTSHIHFEVCGLDLDWYWNDISNDCNPESLAPICRIRKLNPQWNRRGQSCMAYTQQLHTSLLSTCTYMYIENTKFYVICIFQSINQSINLSIYTHVETYYCI